MKVFQY
jgi:hypothetical protein